MSEHDQKKTEAKKQQWAEHNRAKALAKLREREAHDLDKAPAIEARRQFQAIKGTRDLLPPETALWNRVERIAQEVFTSYGFGEIRLPIFEQTELFARSIGAETDVVSKEMYSFEDYDLPDLGRLRSGLLLRRLFFDEYGGVRLFVQQVREFSNGLRQGIDSRDISKTPENERFLKDTETLLGSIPPPPKLLRAGELEDFKRKFDLRIDQIKQALRVVQLGDEVTLRPEATASVCRAFVEHGMHSLPQPVKLYYMGPMFRHERPQKGRFRQFYQIGAEVLETTRPDPTRDPVVELAKDAATDAEVIEMLMTFFDRVGLLGAELSINSIGHAADNCRRRYVAELRAALEAGKEQLDEDSRRRIQTNPLRVLDSKVKQEQVLISTLPRIGDYLCDDCKLQYTALKRELDVRGVKYRENWRLVRGLDYYMRTTFEITAPGLGSQNAVCGGGRYDGLVELLGGPPTKGIGFAIGEDRLILSLQESLGQVSGAFGEDLPNFAAVLQRPDVAVTGTSENTWDQAVELATTLRKRGLSVFLPKPGTKLQRAFDAASKLGIRVAILVGEDELRHNNYVIRVLRPVDPLGLRDFPVQTTDVLLYGKIVKLRQDLERALLRLATGLPDSQARHNIPFLIDRLLQKDLLPIKAAEAVRNVVPLLNRALHGESLAPDSIEWALAFGNLLLNELEKLSPSEV